MNNEEQYDHLPGFMNQFGDGHLGELDPKEWTALDFLEWLQINNFKIIKNDRKSKNKEVD